MTRDGTKMTVHCLAMFVCHREFYRQVSYDSQVSYAYEYMHYDEFSHVCKTCLTKCHVIWHPVDNFCQKVDNVFENSTLFIQYWPNLVGSSGVTKVLIDHELKFLETVGKPPRVLLYKVNKTMVKWFNNFLPSECRKFSPIYRRMKGLKRQITKLMPKHQFITAEIENWKNSWFSVNVSHCI